MFFSSFKLKFKEKYNKWGDILYLYLGWGYSIYYTAYIYFVKRACLLGNFRVR